MLPAVATKVKGWCDDFVAGIDIQCHQGKQQGVRARCTPQGELAAHKRGDFSLQFPHLGSHDKQLALQNFPNRILDFRLHQCVFGLEIEKGKEQRRDFLLVWLALAVSDCISKFNYSDCDNFPRGHPRIRHDGPCRAGQDSVET